MLVAFPLDLALCDVVIYFRFVLREIIFAFLEIITSRQRGFFKQLQWKKKIKRFLGRGAFITKVCNAVEKIIRKPVCLKQSKENFLLSLFLQFLFLEFVWVKGFQL